jgi:hypothetical protein
MKRLQTREILAGVLLAALACRGDPTSSLRGGAKVIDLSTNVMFITAGATKTIKVVVRDEQLNPLPVDVAVTSGNAAIMTVVADTAVPVANGTTHSFLVTAVAPGHTTAIVQGGGLSDSVAVSVLPVNFAGAVSKATPKGGDTIVVTSTALLRFDTTLTQIVFGAQAGTLLHRTRDSLVYLMPFGVTGGDSVTHVQVTYVPGLLVQLPMANQAVTTGDRWAPGDTGYATAPTLALPTVTGKSVKYLTQLPSVFNNPDCAEGTGVLGLGKCTIFKYVANGTDSLQFIVNWTPPTTASTDNSDIDIYSCDSTGVAGCFETYITNDTTRGVGGKDTLQAAGATVSTPEKFSWIPPAGIHYLVIERYSSGEGPNVYVTITKKK